jgi:uncharacterized phage protein (TIGR01671 family)
MLKFRAWHKEKKKMFEVGQINFGLSGAFKEDGGYILCEGVSAGDGVFYPKEVILMQSTDLKDKNGKEIFEGDIIKTDADYKTKFIVVWCNDGNMIAGFCGKNIQAEGKPKADYYLHKGSHVEIQYLNPMKVIGNIHENPELLKDVKP